MKVTHTQTKPKPRDKGHTNTDRGPPPGPPAGPPEGRIFLHEEAPRGHTPPRRPPGHGIPPPAAHPLQLTPTLRRPHSRRSTCHIYKH